MFSTSALWPIIVDVVSRPTLRLQSDDRLVALTRAGSERAFETIVRRYRASLLRYCGRLIGRDRAEDIVQQTFLNALVSLRDDDRFVNLKPWLYRIAHNLTINALRKNGWDHDPLDENLDGVMDPSELVEQRLSARTVLDRIEALPQRQRTALLLRELQGRSYEEIAATISTEKPAVRQLLHRARRSVRDGLGALVPLSWLRTCLASQPPAAVDHERVGELVAGSAAGGMLAKAAVATVVAGVLATGTGISPSLEQELPRHDRDGATAALAAPATAGRPGPQAIQPARVADRTGTGHRGELARHRRKGRDGDLNEHGSSERHARDGAEDHGSSGPEKTGDLESPSGEHSGDGDRSGSGAGAELPAEGDSHEGESDGLTPSGEAGSTAANTGVPVSSEPTAGTEGVGP
jgi:RNA polymerase sigma factor (sigma-70 family)